MPDLPELLHRTLSPVLEAGRRIRAEFLRPDGPRGSGHTAPVDEEIENFLREALQALLAARFVGEETEPVAGPIEEYCWLVDPHDGTSEFLQGARGSAVSVALLRAGEPVLGVVHSPLSPDRGPDCIAWAEGMDHLLRNGTPIRPRLAEQSLTSDAIVMLAYNSHTRPATNHRRIAPAGFVSSTSIAYRLARVAAGDAIATVSRQSRLSAHDYAAGHALLRGAGGVLVDGLGHPPAYTRDGRGGMDKCFAGAPAAVTALVGRDWSLGRPAEPPLPILVALDWPRREDGLDRAIGALAGHALCATGEGRELAIALSRALLTGRGSRAVALAYRSWPGNPATVEPILRVTPYGLCCADPAEAAARALADARLTHSDPRSALVCAPFAAAVSAAIRGGTAEAMRSAAREAARLASADTDDAKAVRAALDGRAPGGTDQPTSLLADGFFHLERGSAIGDLVGYGGAAGALLGAIGGRAALPGDRLLHLLSSRPSRPSAYWAADLPLLAEALLRSH